MFTFPSIGMSFPQKTSLFETLRLNFNGLQQQQQFPIFGSREICNFRKCHIISDLFVQGGWWLSARQPKLNAFSFQNFSQICAFSNLTPLAVLLQIRDICQRLNRDWVLGGDIIMNKDGMLWFHLMLGQTKWCNRFSANTNHAKIIK